MNSTLNIGNILSGIFALVLITIGILNIIFVHPVPGIISLLLSLLYIPYSNIILRKRFGFKIPAVVKIILAIAVIMFTFGVSDLGDMLDKL